MKKTSARPEGRKPSRRRPGRRRPAEENDIFTPARSLYFQDGHDNISWTWHNRDVGGQLIEENAWIWPDVSAEILASISPEGQGHYWTCLKPRARFERAIAFGEHPEVYRKAGNLDAIPERVLQQGAYAGVTDVVRLACSVV
ncbi:MAG TPA: hypothetical protein PKY77_22360 [Phycisphaerae bacterium]|nr:hypothetical protein [Phycisphaerae bacterium]HRY71267.1 hypothetical protein [Phycisphaerae bacterium]HSA29641.1 hypothetical protein [Phycisphaerae bacterium]